MLLTEYHFSAKHFGYYDSYWTQLKQQDILISGLPRWPSGNRICLPVQETQETQVRSLGQEDPLEGEMASLSNILAWKIPWTEEPGYSPRGCKESDTTKHTCIPIS